MIGTSMEVFFAHQLDKPVILFGDAHKKIIGLTTIVICVQKILKRRAIYNKNFLSKMDTKDKPYLYSGRVKITC